MPKTILIIEDDDFSRELLRKKLSSGGFNIIEATSGDRGIDMMIQKKPDVVLLDLLLPNVDGFSVLTQAKTHNDIASIPIIVLSNLGQQDDIERGIKLGASDYLIKSQIDLDQIIDKINKIIGK